MIEQSDKCIVVADFSKFHRNAFVKISDTSVADCIVTNASIGKDILDEFEEAGIQVII